MLLFDRPQLCINAVLVSTDHKTRDGFGSSADQLLCSAATIGTCLLGGPLDCLGAVGRHPRPTDHDSDLYRVHTVSQPISDLSEAVVRGTVTYKSLVIPGLGMKTDEDEGGSITKADRNLNSAYHARSTCLCGLAAIKRRYARDDLVDRSSTVWTNCELHRYATSLALCENKSKLSPIARKLAQLALTLDTWNESVVLLRAADARLETAAAWRVLSRRNGDRLTCWRWIAVA